MSKLPSAGSKDTVLMAISSGPSFNYTSHKKDAVAGYTLYSFIDNAEATAEHTFFNGQPAYLLDQTTQPKCFGVATGSTNMRQLDLSEQNIKYDSNRPLAKVII